MKTPESTLTYVYECLKDLPAGQVKEKAIYLANHYGVALQTVYRWAWQKGLRWRKDKSTKGKTRVNAAVLNQAATILYSSRRTSNEIPIPGCDAKEMLEDSGIDTGSVSTGWFLNLLRQRQISAQDILKPSPHVNLLSDHPNHVWQFDVTNCIQYFLEDKGMGERDPEMELYKNKIVKTAKKIKRELLRYVAVDHCTGAFYFRYFYATGELAVDGAQFLFEAMRPKDELIEKTFNGTSESKKGKYHFHGVPFMLIADRGSIMAAKANQKLFDALNIKYDTHLPGNPRAKGAVEGLMHIINRFEGKLKFDRPANTEHLNARALDWAIMFNGLKDMRGIAPRSALWSKIRDEQLRLCPEEKVFKRCISIGWIEKKVTGALLVMYRGNSFRVPDVNLAHKKISIRENAYESPAIDACGNGFTWLLRPIEKDEYGRLTDGVRFGEYKSLKHTETQNAKTELEKIAQGWGLTWKGTGDKRIAVAPPVGYESTLQVFGHQADKVKVDFIQRKGVELKIKQAETPQNKPLEVSAFQVSRDISARHIPFTEFLKRLIAEVGPISKELNQQLRAEYGDSIEISQAEKIIADSEEHRAGNNGQKKVAEM